MSNRHTQPNQPFPLRRCYFCGTFVQVKHPDEFRLRIHKNGRSFVFCIEHLKKLLSVASYELIEDYRRRYLKEENKVLKVKPVMFETMIQDLINFRTFIDNKSLPYGDMR
jgi:hypothetical protein